MPNEIWTITTLSDRKYIGTALQQKRAASSRCWGFYFSRDKALAAALGSADWFSECGYYTHVVIEHAQEGILHYDHTPVWIELRRLEKAVQVSRKDSDGEEYVYVQEFEAVRVEAPEWARCIVGFGMG